MKIILGRISGFGTRYFGRVTAMLLCCLVLTANTLTFTATAATTPPIWYLTDVRDVGLTSEDNDGFYVRNNIKYALIYPWADNSILIPETPLGGIAYRKSNTFYSTSNPITPSNKGWFTGFGILNAWEPYSFYNFRIDQNWRIDIEDSSESSSSVAKYWFVADRNQRASVELNLEIGKYNSSDYADASQTISADNQYLFDTQGNWGVGVPFSTKWINTLSMIRGGGLTDPYYNSGSININDLIVSVVPSTIDVPEGDYLGSGTNYARLFLFCPVSYLPEGLKFGDVYPVGSSYVSPYEGILDDKAKTPEQILEQNQILSDAANESETTAIDDLGLSLSNINRLTNIFFPQPVISIISVFGTFFILLFFVKKGMT